MQQLLEYHIKDTNEKMAALRVDLRQIDRKLDDLTKFKVEMIVSSRWVSLLVSSFCGLLTLVVSTYIALKTGHP